MKMATEVQLLFLQLITVFCTAAVTGSQEFFKQPENITAVQGSTVTLKCVTKNRVNGQVQWTKGGFGLGMDPGPPTYPRYSIIGSTYQLGTDKIEEFSLKITRLQWEEDDDRYQCQVMSTDQAMGIVSNFAYINVLVPPSQPSLGGNTIPVILERGNNVTCEVLNGKPKSRVTWKKDGKRLTEKVYELVSTQPDGKLINTTSLVTITPQVSDAGKRIECGAWNEALQGRDSYWTHGTLDVQYAPRITLGHNNVDRTMREFDDVVFECKGEANPYEIDWKWYQDGEEIPNENRNVLEIPRISRDYHGSIIKCVATNTVGSTEIEHSMNVLCGPQFKPEPSHSLSVDLNARAELKCQATGNPSPKITWRRQGQFHVLHSSSTYVIPHVTKDLFGVYVCTATVIGFNEISSEIYLTENGKPKIMSDKTQYGEVGSTARLQCMSISSPPPDKIVWTRWGEAIDYSAKQSRFSAPEEGLPYGRKSILEIREVEESDFGEYNCTVVNSYGEDFLVVTLTEKDELPLPIILGASLGGLAFIFLIVIGYFIYSRCNPFDNESYADTDSNTEIKKRDKNESPSELTKSTLMEQWRQDYNYRYSADYDDMDSKGNNNGMYGSFVADPYTTSPEYGNPEVITEYSQDSNNMGTLGSVNRFENSYSTGYFPSTFRSNSRTDFSGRTSTDPADPYRLPPADLSTTKLATNV